MKVILKLLPSTSYPMLKGTDYIVFSSAKFLGLPVHVKPLLEYRHDNNPVFPIYTDYALKGFSAGYVATTNSEHYGCRFGQCVLTMFGENACQYNPDDITWCEPPQYNQPAGAITYYGNEETMFSSYKAGAILIGIPKWNESRRQIMSVGTLEQGDYVVHDNVESCFE